MKKGREQGNGQKEGDAKAEEEKRKVEKMEEKGR